MSVNKERIVRTFLDLVQIDSLSRKEGKIASFLEKRLKELGLETFKDGAGQKAGSETGNLLARLPGKASLPPILLSSHMDTVGPGEGIRPIVEKDRIRSDGRTILGADCKSGIAAILETLEILKERKIPHGDVEVAFTVCEEIGLLGAKNLDYSKIRAKTALVLDTTGAHELVIRAPAADRLEFVVRGVEAHSGVCPEKGISAIQMTAEAVSKMRLGRIDRETTANLGVIEGGIATNIVPPLVRIKGEARSLKVKKLELQSRHMKECFEKAARKFKGQVESSVQRGHDPLNLSRKSPLALKIQKAAKELKSEVRLSSSGGASDANIFFNKGIEAANLGTGMRDIHTVREWLDLEDFFFCAELTLRFVAQDRG